MIDGSRERMLRLLAGHVPPRSRAWESVMTCTSLVFASSISTGYKYLLRDSLIGSVFRASARFLPATQTTRSRHVHGRRVALLIRHGCQLPPSLPCEFWPARRKALQFHRLRRGWLQMRIASGLDLTSRTRTGSHPQQNVFACNVMHQPSSTSSTQHTHHRLTFWLEAVVPSIPTVRYSTYFQQGDAKWRGPRGPCTLPALARRSRFLTCPASLSALLPSRLCLSFPSTLPVLLGPHARSNRPPRHQLLFSHQHNLHRHPSLPSSALGSTVVTQTTREDPFPLHTFYRTTLAPRHNRPLHWYQSDHGGLSQWSDVRSNLGISHPTTLVRTCHNPPLPTLRSTLSQSNDDLRHRGTTPKDPGEQRTANFAPTSHAIQATTSFVDRLFAFLGSRGLVAIV